MKSIEKQQYGWNFQVVFFLLWQCLNTKHSFRVTRFEQLNSNSSTSSLAIGGKERNVGELEVRTDGRELRKEPLIVGMKSHKSQTKCMYGTHANNEVVV